MTKQPDISDEAVQKATGKEWPAWFELIDTAGGMEMSHQQIVAFLNEHHEVSGWWQQMITNSYEQARGKREKHQMTDGYQIGASKTVPFPLAPVVNAWLIDDERQQWLEEAIIDLRQTSPQKSIWFTWTDGASRVNVRFSAKEGAKSIVSLQHNKIPDGDTAVSLKTFWRARLQALQAYLETAATSPPGNG